MTSDRRSCGHRGTLPARKTPAAPFVASANLWVMNGYFAGDGKAELDEAALRGCEVERLSATVVRRSAQEVRAFLVDGVEDRADHVKRRDVGRSVVHDPHADLLVRLHADRAVRVLAHVAVEDDTVPLFGEELVVVDRLGRVALRGRARTGRTRTRGRPAAGSAGR